MITSIELTDHENVQSFKASSLSNINIIFSEDTAKKTLLFKSLYSAIRSIEEFKRGEDIRSIEEILLEKLHWTFQIKKLSEIVDKSLYFKLETISNKNSLEYTLNTEIDIITSPEAQKDGNSIFIPAKEILSIFSDILKTRELKREFGFDDTVYDLAKALYIAPSIEERASQINSWINGKIDYNSANASWFFKNESNESFPIGIIPEGIRRISVIPRLLNNGLLGDNSLLFIDEIESSLSLGEIDIFLDVISYISKKLEIQIFISTNDLNILKKLSEELFAKTYII